VSQIVIGTLRGGETRKSETFEMIPVLRKINLKVGKDLNYDKLRIQKIFSIGIGPDHFHGCNRCQQKKKLKKIFFYSFPTLFNSGFSKLYLYIPQLALVRS